MHSLSLWLRPKFFYMSYKKLYPQPSLRHFWFWGHSLAELAERPQNDIESSQCKYWANPDAEKTRQCCYWWRALLLKVNNGNTQGGLPEQKEWMTCLAFRDFSIMMRWKGRTWSAFVSYWGISQSNRKTKINTSNKLVPWSFWSEWECSGQLEGEVCTVHEGTEKGQKKAWECESGDGKTDATKSYCLAKAVYSLARRRIANCLSIRSSVCPSVSCPTSHGHSISYTLITLFLTVCQPIMNFNCLESYFVSVSCLNSLWDTAVRWGPFIIYPQVYIPKRRTLIQVLPPANAYTKSAHAYIHFAKFSKQLILRQNAYMHEQIT